eukprot:Phypoly_transcript_09463.p1 GENE.Phypoly_transcript_09463~~Phypoly_transcript_09463.p1  ORF type:complete len:431 (+),score=72.72 Phypoly_transcript_09463:104-1396(+)
MLPLFIYRAYYLLRAYLAHILAHAHALLRTASSPPYPTPAPSVSPVWLTRVLRDQGTIAKNVRVARVDMGGFEAAGFEGTMKQIKVEYVEEATNKPAAGPPSFVLKTSSDSIAARYSIITGGNNREALFYSHKYSREVKTPQAFYSYSNGFLGEHLILLEDMTLLPQYTKVGMVFGNQIWGVTKPTHYTPDETIKKMYFVAADLHAKFWKDENLLSQSWLRESGWYKNQNRHLWELSMEHGRSCWRAVQVRHKAGTLGFELSPKLAAIIEKSFARASWANLQAHLQNPAVPWTFCHGDFHAGNMVLANEEIHLVDWSQCGPWEPTADLAQTIISDVKPEVFQKHTKEWVRAYWDRLTKLGISEKEYPFSTCWERFCMGGPERWIWLFVIMIQMPAVPVPLNEYFQDQLLGFIECHGDHEFYILKPMVILF